MIYYLREWIRDGWWNGKDWYRHKVCFFLHGHRWEQESRRGHSEYQLYCPKCLLTWPM